VIKFLFVLLDGSKTVLDLLRFVPTTLASTFYGFMPFVGTRSLETPAGTFPAGFPLRPAPAYVVSRQKN